MKKFQLEVWNTFDKLCLMSAITKLKTSFADQNWVAISRYTKQLHETISSFIQYDSRSDEWFSAKQCSAQYEVLIKGSGARKKKKVDRNFDYSDVHEALLVSLNQEFCDELQLSLKDIRDEYIKTKQLVEDLDTDKVDDERLDLLINDFLEKEKVTDIKTKLKSMLDEKNAVECESSTKYPSPLSSEPSTSSEHKTANITTSPLLTSLLQSPSPLVRPSPSTSSPTISLLLHSSPSVSLTDPTLSKLLESPSTLPGTSTITALENSPFIIQGKTLDTQQSSPEIKKKEAAEAGGEMSVQRIINDPEEFQRAVGFDDMSDIEQGVVESEVIIENESSPIKRLAPRRLDLENIGDEEPEEEILETVEEIIERVEEAIIETVGENNINELVLNQGIDSVSISDEEIENITIGDNTYEVIVVGSSQEEDQIKIEDATPKTVIDPNQDICREVSLIKGLKKGGKSKDEDVTNNKDDSIIPIIDLVDKEISKNLIVHEDKPVMNAAVSAPEKGPEKQSEDVDNPYNLDINSGLTVEKSAVNRNINSTKSVEHSVSSTSESIDHDLLDQDLCDKKEKIINVCQTNLLGDNSAPNNAIVKNTICYDEKLEEPIKTKSMQESVTDKSEVKVEPHEKVDKILETEKQSNKVLIHSDEFNRICEDKGDCLTDITQNVVKERVENKPSVLFNEDVLKKDINTDSKNEKATKCDKAVVFSDLVQSAAMPTLPDKIGSTTSENIVKQNYSCKMSNKNIKNKSGDETLLEAAESSEVISIGSSDSGSSEELVVLSDIENTPPISKPTVIAKPKLNMEQFEKAINTKNTIASKEEEPVNTKIKHVKEDKQSKKRLETDLEKQKNVIISEEKEQQIFENIETNTGSVRIPELDDEVKGSSDDKEIDETQEGKEIQEAQTSQQAQEILQSQESTIIGETQECLGTGKAFGTEEVQGALETDENLITHESQETFETQATHENQESHDGFDENSTIQISSESDESKSDSTEETEDNSILTTEDSKDGLDDSLKFSSLETLSMPSVDSPPECNDPKLAGLNTKEREFRSLIGRGFEELKSKAAELVSLPEQFREKNGSKKQAKGKNKPRTKKDKPSKSKKVTQKTNWEKSSEKKTAKEKSSKDRTSKEKPREKFTNSGRRSKYLNTFDSKPDSPSLSTTSSDEDRDYKSWKKSILLVYNRLASHKYASVFSKPITDNEAPSYHELILRPMDLSTIKRNIENGVIRTTVEFQRDMLLMVQNAIIYNKCDTPVYDMARAMGEDMLAQMEVMVQALGDGVPLIGDTSEEKQITRARTSKSSVEPPQTKKRKIQEPDDIRPKRNKSSTAC